jgi:hypothetical protein
MCRVGFCDAGGFERLSFGLEPKQRLGWDVWKNLAMLAIKRQDSLRFL